MTLSALTLHQGGWVDMGFLNPLHLQGCGGRISYLRSSSIPPGTQKRVILMGQGDDKEDRRIYTGAQVMITTTDGTRPLGPFSDATRPLGPFFLGGYRPATDTLVLGDRLGSLHEIGVGEIKHVTVVHPSGAQKGAEDGALVGGLVAVALATAAGASSGEGMATGALIGSCLALPASGAGALAGAVVGSGSYYDEEYPIDDDHWAFAYEPLTQQAAGPARTTLKPSPAPPAKATVSRPAGTQEAGRERPDRCKVAETYHLKRPIGCPCDSREQCATSHCLPVDGPPVCTQVCTTECPQDFVCRSMKGAGGQGLCVRAVISPGPAPSKEDAPAPEPGQGP